MAICYDFLKDENELKKFANFLPDLAPNECYCLMLGARNKYLTVNQKDFHLTGSDMLRRLIVRNKPKKDFREHLIDQVKTLCVPNDFYRDNRGLPIPENAFVAYLTPNPRNGKKAACDVMKTLSDMFLNDSDRFDDLQGILLTAYHTNPSRKVFMDLDIDLGEGDDLVIILKSIRNIMGGTKMDMIITRGGAHVLITKNTIDLRVANTFYQNLTMLKTTLGLKGEIEIKSEIMCPVPGTAQGGHIPMINTL
jgi:hypothetical protein